MHGVAEHRTVLVAMRRGNPEAAEHLRRKPIEQDKPLSEARGEIDYAASFVEWYAEEGKRPNIEGITSYLPDAELSLRRVGARQIGRR